MASRLHIFIILLLFARTACADIANGSSQPAFWQLTSHDKQVTTYLLGSMHFGVEEFYPLPQEVLQAFHNSSNLVVEVDVTHLDPQESFNQIQHLVQLEPGKDLLSMLGSETLNSLNEICDRYGVPLEQLKGYRPWFVAVALANIQMKRLGFNEYQGVDRYFLDRSSSHKVIELETMESQLGLFNEITLEEQIYFLKQTMDQFENSGEYLKLLSQAWVSGDAGALEKLIVRSMEEEPKLQRLYQLLFVYRNRIMAEKISAMVNKKQQAFIVVGVGHLVGETGLIEQLKNNYEVKKITFKK